MEEFNDKSQTMKFTPPHEDNNRIQRTEDSVYSRARQNNDYYSLQKEEGSNRTLVYVAVVLAVLLIIAVAAGLFVINKDNYNNQTDSSGEEIVIQSENEEEEEQYTEEKEEEIKEEIKTNRYNVVFHSIMEKEGQYSVLADLFDESMNEVDNRKLIINEETDIRENGKRLSPEGLIYAVESMAGDRIVFDAVIRENDNVVMSISFDIDLEEQTSMQEEEINQSGETSEENEEIQTPPETEETTQEETTETEMFEEVSPSIAE